jgi:hypothetical protein
LKEQKFTVKDSLFADGDDKATPLAEMVRLLDEDPRVQERILPYLGGEEVNTSPTHNPSRFVINFEDLPLDKARQWPALLDIVERKVKPERRKMSRELEDWPWWQFWRIRGELRNSLQHRQRVLVLSAHTEYCSFVFAPTNCVFSHALVVIALSEYSAYATLQSRSHETWARFFGSSLGDTLRYTPSDCFETFPFPPDWESNETIQRFGKECYEFRADLMVRNNGGLTKTFNRFHNPDERDHDILKLRVIHDAMDRAVLDAHGWTDLKPTCEFILDYEEEVDDDGGKPRRKKKPWRYRWPDEFRDEVLARLLALNQERAAKEKAMSATSDHKQKKTKKSGRRTSGDAGNKPLFERN